MKDKNQISVTQDELNLRMYRGYSLLALKALYLTITSDRIMRKIKASKLKETLRKRNYAKTPAALESRRAYWKRYWKAKQEARKTKGQ